MKNRLKDISEEDYSELVRQGVDITRIEGGTYGVSRWRKDQNKKELQTLNTIMLWGVIITLEVGIIYYFLEAIK